MKNEIKIELPLKAVSLNQAYPTNKMGRRYLCQEGKSFKESVYYWIIGKCGYQPKEKDRFEVFITFHFKDNRRRDIDDYFKLLLDVFTDAHYWLDDSQIISLWGRKFQGKENKIEIKIKKYGKTLPTL